MVIVERHRHSVVGEHQEGQGPVTQFVSGDEMCNQRLKKSLVRNPGGREETPYVLSAGDEVQHFLHCLAAQAPPLAANPDAQVFWQRALQTEFLLQRHSSVKQRLVFALVEEMPVDQPFFLQARLDPVALEIVVMFDEIGVVLVQELVHVLGGLDCHAIAGQHVEMGCPRIGICRRLHRVERGLHQRPLPPTAFHALSCKCYVGVPIQRFSDLCIVFWSRACIEMYGHAVAFRGQPNRLPDNGLGIFVTQQDVGDFCQWFANCSFRF